MLNEKGFDLWADGYDKSVALSDEDNTYPFAGYKEVLNRIFGRVLERKDAVVLDIGFGTGTLTAKLYEHGCEIWGQDFSEKMIELAKPKMPQAHLFWGDFSNGLAEPLLQHTYDFIIATYSLHHLTQEQKVSFLQSLCSLLSENGKIIIGDVAFTTQEELEQCRLESGNDWDEEEYYMVWEEMKQAFPKAVFEKVSYCAGVLTI